MKAIPQQGKVNEVYAIIHAEGYAQVLFASKKGCLLLLVLSSAYALMLAYAKIVPTERLRLLVHVCATAKNRLCAYILRIEFLLNFSLPRSQSVDSK